MNPKIRRGDTVEVITGAYRGVRGEVLRVLPKESRVVVKGINTRKKHQRQVQAAGRTVTPGIMTFEAPISLSKVLLVCPKCGKASRVGIDRESGKARRVCKKCQAVIDA
ncbi:MAG: 50S ribosomal protein L24 [Anaerolineales bacterium]|nr:50S ribosomal protein L24 [Anaerolineales bacterium]